MKAIKQDRWNNSETDRGTERAFLDEHKGPGRFSGKYGPQPVQTELDWKMPWGSWLDFKGLSDLSEAWKEAMKEFGEDGASTAVHQMQGERATLQANYDRKDWDAMQTWVKNACAQWNSDQKDTGRTSKCDDASGTRGAITRDSVKWVFTGQSAEEQAQEWQKRQRDRETARQRDK